MRRHVALTTIIAAILAVSAVNSSGPTSFLRWLVGLTVLAVTVDFTVFIYQSTPAPDEPETTPPAAPEQ